MANFTPQEIEEILQAFFNVTGRRQYIGARYVPIFGRKNENSIEWNNSAAYEPLSIVLYNGDSYTSRRYVPAGIDISDAGYWVVTGRYNAQVEQYRQEVLGFDTRIETNTDAIEAIENVLPFSDFDSTNTVKKYIDDDIEAIENVLPFSDFDSTNTVKKYIDDENTEQTTSLKNDLVPFPDYLEYPKYGSLGQVLTSLANGETKWENPVVPSDAQAEQVITTWLTAHPEATTTVQDGAITYAKLNTALKNLLQTYTALINTSNFEAHLPTLAEAKLNSYYTLTMSSSLHQTDYPTEIGYDTFTLITIGNNSYRIQYMLGPNFTSKCALRRYYNATWHDWAITDGRYPIRYVGSVSNADYTLLSTLANAEINSLYIVSMTEETHQTDYPTNLGYGTYLLLTLGFDGYKVQYMVTHDILSNYAMRRYYSGSWHNWSFSANFNFISSDVNYNTYQSSLPTLSAAKNNSVYIMTMSSSVHQEDYPTQLGYGTYTLLTLGSDTYKIQYVFTPTIGGNKAIRRYFSGAWHNWTMFNAENTVRYVGEVNYNSYAALSTLGNAATNSVYIMTMSSAAHQSDYPTLLGYSTYMLVTLGNSNYKTQYVLNNDINGRNAMRRYYGSAWHDWTYSPESRRSSITIGSGGDFTTLVEGLAYAYSTKNVDVTIKDGTYNVASEMQSLYGNDYFDSESFSDFGPLIGNGCKYYFQAGAFVSCVLPNTASTAAQNKFSPLNAGAGDFELVGLRIYSEFCRYSIHDELQGTRTYHHVYKDCNMHHNDNGAGYCQCIGGGLGAHGLIDIESCVFESETLTDPEPSAVSWHNGINSNIQSFVNIHNCYFKTGHVRFSWYGASTLISEMNVSNCSFNTLATESRAETAESTIENVTIRSWNNEIRNP